MLGGEKKKAEVEDPFRSLVYKFSGEGLTGTALAAAMAFARSWRQWLQWEHLLVELELALEAESEGDKDDWRPLNRLGAGDIMRNLLARLTPFRTWPSRW